MVSESFSRQHLGGLDSAVGKAITLNGGSYVVIGVVANADRFRMATTRGSRSRAIRVRECAPRGVMK